MIHDLALRWVVTLLFVFSAGVCVRAIATHRHSVADVVSHTLHAVMAVAMAVMAWPRGAELPTRAPMVFFAVAAVWFVLVIARTAGHRPANAYHALMMLAMAWMYAAMGGLPLRTAAEPTATAMSGMDMPDMPGMAGGSAHAGHGGQAAAGTSGTDEFAWPTTLNWLCTIGFAAAAVFWFYRLVTARVQRSDDGSHQSVGVLCQLAMAAGMAIMFGVML